MNIGDCAIRLLEPEADAALYRGIRLEALRTNPESFGSDFDKENARSLEWFAERLATSDVLGCFDGTEVIGLAGLAVQPGVKREHKGLLWGMYVRPRARRRGIGRRLVQAILMRARERTEIIQLAVNRTSQPARRLYTALGFQEYGLEKDAMKIGERYCDEILMVLDLRLD